VDEALRTLKIKNMEGRECMHIYAGGETEYGITLVMPEDHPRRYMRFYGSLLSKRVIHGAVSSPSLGLSCVGPGSGTTERMFLHEYLLEECHEEDEAREGDEDGDPLDDDKIYVAGHQYFDVRMGNGARLYVDCGHPEYSTGMVSNARDALLAQLAGDMIVEEGRRVAEECMRKEYGPDIRLLIYKNNSDGQGRIAKSYAHHENYSLDRATLSRIFTVDRRAGAYAIFPGELAPIVMNFLISRIIITGAGKVWRDVLPLPRPYQISQRADFFLKEFGEHATEVRPIINTRQVPYASTCGRLHVIPGDTNVSHYSIYLTWGTGLVFFMMLQDGFITRYGKNVLKQLHRPVQAFWRVSGDLTLRKKLCYADGSSTTALEMQRELCDLAERFVRQNHLGEQWTDVVEKWGGALDGLDGDEEHWNDHNVSRNLDWVAKLRFIRRYQENRRVDWSHALCKNIDLAYHDTNPQRSIAQKLQNRGDLSALAHEDEIMHWVRHPPPDTRSFLLGSIIARYGKHLYRADWSDIVFPRGRLTIGDPGIGGEHEVQHLFAGDLSCKEFVLRLEQWINHVCLSGCEWKAPNHLSFWT